MGPHRLKRLAALSQGIALVGLGLSGIACSKDQPAELPSKEPETQVKVAESAPAAATPPPSAVQAPPAAAPSSSAAAANSAASPSSAAPSSSVALAAKAPGSAAAPIKINPPIRTNALPPKLPEYVNAPAPVK